MNYVQVALLRRLRGELDSGAAAPSAPSGSSVDPADFEEIHDAVRLSVNGIAAGLRNTG